MQVQIKRQLKIELDQADITTAVRDYLANSGYNISEDDLAKINYVKSPRDGLRAELNITEETSDVESEAVVGEAIPDVPVAPAVTPEAAPEPAVVEDTVEEEPDLTVSEADVMPSVDEAKALVAEETATAVEEAPKEEAQSEAPRTRLFGV